MTKSKAWMLVNVVWYDGVAAYVTKFILQAELISDKLTEESIKLTEEEIAGNGEILKYDVLYPLSHSNIEAFKLLEDAPADSDEYSKYLAYKRYTEMWF